MNYIYTIGNTKNNMVYIGQTSRDVETRFKEHKTLARAGGSEDKFH
jgi:predicted GIY-YIG superfamily endonuclease